METVKNAVRITCKTSEQANVLLNLTNILAMEITATIPYKYSKGQTSQRKIWQKGVIKRVDKSLGESYIKQQTAATWVKRIRKYRGQGSVETGTVIIAYDGELPKSVTVGITDYDVEIYYQEPIRCNRCQRFNHKAIHCKAAKAACVRCGGDHDYNECTVNSHSVKCVNCGKAHSSAYKGCEQYQTISKALKVVAINKISYAEAVQTVANRAASNPSTTTTSTAPAAATATAVAAGRPVNATAPAPPSRPSTTTDRQARIELRALQQQVDQIQSTVKTLADFHTTAAQPEPTAEPSENGERATAQLNAQLQEQSDTIRHLEEQVNKLQAALETLTTSPATNPAPTESYLGMMKVRGIVNMLERDRDFCEYLLQEEADVIRWILKNMVTVPSKHVDDIKAGQSHRLYLRTSELSKRGIGRPKLDESVTNK